MNAATFSRYRAGSAAISRDSAYSEAVAQNIEHICHIRASRQIAGHTVFAAVGGNGHIPALPYPP